MKRSLLCLGAIAVLSMASCSNNPDDDLISSPKRRISYMPVMITQSEAKNIADDVYRFMMGQSSTSSTPTPTFDVITNLETTRSTIFEDTLAYIVNYPNNKGFVIVSRERIENPVMIFSKSGNFVEKGDYGKDGPFPEKTIHDSIINNIMKWIRTTMDNKLSHSEHPNSGKTYPKGHHYPWEKFDTIPPQLQIVVKHDGTLAKYVAQKYPGRTLRTPALITALAMAHCKTSVNYHNTNYLLLKIINAIKQQQNLGTHPGVPIIPANSNDLNGGLPDFRPDTYSQAMDSLAKIIYLVSEDINIEYSEVDPKINHKRKVQNARTLLSNLGYTVSSSIKDYTTNDVANAIRFNKFVLLAGDSISCIVDGAIYKCNEDLKIRKSFIHCDWGNNGDLNGFYNCSLFRDSLNEEPTLFKFIDIQRE